MLEKTLNKTPENNASILPVEAFRLTVAVAVTMAEERWQRRGEPLARDAVLQEGAVLSLRNKPLFFSRGQL